jgi:hypothetical protein
LIPRFDRRVDDQGEIRLGVESIYSICGILNSSNEQAFASTVRGLPQTMRECGVDEDVIEARRDRMSALEKSLREVRAP